MLAVVTGKQITPIQRDQFDLVFSATVLLGRSIKAMSRRMQLNSCRRPRLTLAPRCKRPLTGRGLAAGADPHIYGVQHTPLRYASYLVARNNFFAVDEMNGLLGRVLRNLFYKLRAAVFKDYSSDVVA